MIRQIIAKKLSLRTKQTEATSEAKWEAISKRDSHASASVRLAMTFMCNLVLVLLFIQPLFAQTIDKIVAIVNSEIITQSDVDRVLATIEAEYEVIYPDSRELAQKLKQAEANITSQMVEEKLVLSEAKKRGIKIDEDIVEARIEQIRQSFPSAQEFEQAFTKQGLTLKELRDRFGDQEIMKKAVDYFVRSKIKVDPIEISRYYQTHQKKLTHPEKAKIKTILFRVDESCSEYNALKLAKFVLERLNKDEKFEDLAKVYSQGANAEEGGIIGFIEKGQLIKEIDQAIFALEPGEYSHVIKTDQGFRIFKLEERKPAWPLSFTEAQDLIENMLYKEKFAQRFKEWIDELKKEAYISIKDKVSDEQR